MPDHDSMSRDELAAALAKAECDLRGLQEKETLYRGLFDGMIDPYYRADMDGVLILCNPSTAWLLGYDSPEDIVGRRIAEEFYDDPAERDGYIKALGELGSVTGYRVALKGRGGKLVTVEVNSRIVTSETGEPLYIEGVFRDVTRRAEAEEKLRVSELFYRSLFENTGAATVLFDNDGVIEKCNSTFEALAGLPQKDIIGKRKWTDFVDPDDLERMWAYHSQRVVEGAEPPKEYSFNFVSHDGRRRYVHVNVDVVEESQSRTASLVDITDLKQAEAALHTTTSEFESIFDNSQVGIMLLRGGRKLSKGNQRLADILGYESPEEMAGLSMRELHLSDRRFKEYGEKYYKPLVQNEQLHIEYELRRKDGTPVWCNLSGKALNPDDLNEGVIWIVDDLSERKRTENALRDARNYIRNILDSMPSMLVGVDGAGLVTQWNEAASGETGIAPEEAEGRPVNEVLPWLGLSPDMLREDMVCGRLRTISALPVEMNGDARCKNVTVYPLCGTEEQGAVLIVEDVTERVRMEEMMVQNEKMMSVGGLAAGMAHEINNPLGGILGAVQNILTRVAPDHDPNLRICDDMGIDIRDVREYMKRRGILRFLAGIRESGNRAAGIVRTMLDFSRTHSGDKISRDLAKLMEASIELASKDYNLKDKFDFKEINISREYAPDLPEVPVIASEIEQVFLNLLINAAQAMSDEVLSAKEASLTVRLQREDAFVRVEIEDNGPGMSHEERKRIFEPFYTTKSPGLGTGLGLSVSYFIVTRNHCGTLAVESEAGKGATFIVRLPLEIPDPACKEHYCPGQFK